ncbi:MAG: FAD-dependent oxidoreductase [Chloroflexota bacterium]|nr:FAD-dependent oxidoreductase [Chloroflexota bacterium]
MANPRYDVIIMGAGPGGIACAAMLCKQGLKTLVVDKNQTPGGKAIVAEHNGFKFDLEPKLQVPMSGCSFWELYDELGIKDQLGAISCESVKLAYRHKSADKYNVQTVPQTNADPGPLFDLWGLDDKEREDAIPVLAELAFLTPEQLSAMDDITFDEWLKQRNVPWGLYSFFCMHANGSLAEPIDLVAASEQGAIMQHIATAGGGGYYYGGFGRMLGTVADYVKSNGGEFKMGTRIEKINISDGRVTGISTTNGDFDSNIVVSDVGIQPTMLKLIDEKELDRSYLNYIRDLVPGWAFTAVRYFLNKKVVKEQMAMCWADYSWMTMDLFKEVKAGKKLDEEIFFFTVPSNYDPSMAPEGQQCVIAGTICSPDPKAPEIEMHNNLLDKMLDNVFPGFMDACFERQATGPAEVSAATRDSVLPGQGGECVGVGQIVGQCGKHKPSQTTPINGLFIVGADAGGVGMGTHQSAQSGMKGARLVMQHFIKRQASR